MRLFFSDVADYDYYLFWGMHRCLANSTENELPLRMMMWKKIVKKYFSYHIFNSYIVSVEKSLKIKFSTPGREKLKIYLINMGLLNCLQKIRGLKVILRMTNISTLTDIAIRSINVILSRKLDFIHAVNEIENTIKYVICLFDFGTLTFFKYQLCNCSFWKTLNQSYGKSIYNIHVAVSHIYALSSVLTLHHIL